MYVRGSGISHRSARPGATLKWVSRVSRSSKMRSSMRSDCASRPTRGSRLVGLLSMIITRVLGLGLLAQERVRARHAAQARAWSTRDRLKGKRKVPRLVSARERASIFARMTVCARYAYEIFPRIAGLWAPVAEG